MPLEKQVVDTITKTIQSLRDAFDSQTTLSLKWRKNQIEAVIKMMQTEEETFREAVAKDLGKNKFEFYGAEFATVVNEAKDFLHNLSSWAKPQKVATPMFNMKGLASSYIEPTPLGVVLNISPWNYPLQLAFLPLVGAIGAGNCVLLKPSELAPNVSRAIAEIVPKYLDNNCIKVIEGGIDETTEVLKHRFDHIIYTGSTAVGKVIMRAAAEYLTPVTLELGGKNPTFVDTHVDLDVAARRIAWAKFCNAGQTCLTVDYVFVKKEMEEKLTQAIVKEVKNFYGENPKESGDYGKVISTRHVQRLKGYFSEIDPSSIVLGGPDQADETARYFPPTVLKDLPPNSKIMQDEIFGPILLLKTYDDVQEAINYVRARPHPLALYIFTTDRKFKEKIISQTTSGSVCVNDAMMQGVQSTLPFGGVGDSGLGAYHGKKSFDTFSHMRSVLDKPTVMDLGFRYPPYNDSKISQAKWFM